MSTWTFTVAGTGDADAARQQAAGFVDQLEQAGQQVDGGNFNWQTPPPAPEPPPEPAA